MKFLHFAIGVAVLFALANSLGAKKPKKERVYIHTPSEVPIGEPVFVKAPKVLTEYDRCKMECKRKRDAVNLKENIVALREQLAALEAEEAAAASAASGESSEYLRENVGIPGN